MFARATIKADSRRPLVRITAMTLTTPSARRGNVLIFVLAILAVLALLGTTYITRANLTRVRVVAHTALGC